MVQGKRIAGYLSMLVMGAALMVSGTVLSQTSYAQAAKGGKTLEGVVSDANCGAKHHIPDAAKCTAGCVSKGGKYALVVGDKVYTLEGKTEGLDKLAGQKAKVTGAVKGDTVTVASAEAEGY